jgi:hypothetical protein
MDVIVSDNNILINNQNPSNSSQVKQKSNKDILLQDQKEILDLYDFNLKLNNFNKFLATFSLSKKVDILLKESTPTENNLIIMVNTKHYIYRHCEWDYAKTNKYASQSENFNEIRSIASELTLIIDNILNFNIDTEKRLSINQINKNTPAFLFNTPIIYSFSKTLKKFENNINLFKLKNELYVQSKENNKCLLFENLSIILNEANTKVKREFLRIILFIGSQEVKINEKLLSHLIKTFNNELSIVFNIFLLENDFSQTKDSISEFSKFSDFSNNSDVNAQLKSLYEVYFIKELKIKEISLAIYKFLKEILSDISTKQLIDFFDRTMSVYNQIYNDIQLNISNKNFFSVDLIKNNKLIDYCHSQFQKDISQNGQYYKNLTIVREKIQNLTLFYNAIKIEEDNLKGLY